MENFNRFVIIDDDPVHNALCKLVIKMELGKAEVIFFQDAQEGLNFFSNQNTGNINGHFSLILLDLNMPVIDGWEFLEQYDKLETTTKNSSLIYILSTSEDPHDRNRALSNKNVKDYFVKPLTKEMINKMIKEREQL